MKARAAHNTLVTLGALALAACAGQGAAPVQRAASGPVQFRMLETARLSDDLIEVKVELQGAVDGIAVVEYARCVAAHYAQFQGYGFARHIRTSVDNRGGVWRGDAIYTISRNLPQGMRTLDTQVVVQNCAEQGIPTA